MGLQLKAMGIPYGYETFRIPYKPKALKHYTPDFTLPNGIIVETKGRFVTADREKLKLIKQQHPDLDIRLVFSNSRQRISKQSRTTYALWAETHGFPFADRLIPSSWIIATTNVASHRAIAALQGGTHDRAPAFQGERVPPS